MIQEALRVVAIPTLNDYSSWVHIDSNGTLGPKFNKKPSNLIRLDGFLSTID